MLVHMNNNTFSYVSYVHHCHFLLVITANYQKIFNVVNRYEQGLDLHVLESSKILQFILHNMT